jgi:S-adenosylmethionine:tRNA ribosyltransferase-isomerase
MRTDAFDFNLPERLIALRPARPRDSARLLVVRGPDGRLEDRRVSDLPDLLAAGDVLVANDTRVLAAQLRALRPARDATGHDVEVEFTLHRRAAADVWRVFARPARRLRPGDALSILDPAGGWALGAAVTARDAATGELELRFELAGEALDAALDRAGAPPLPPYIAARRGADADDARDYQTLFAARPGSVAAPTAGLHFTPRLLEALASRGVGWETVTLHVNGGTFLPIKTDDVRAHRLTAEWAELAPGVAGRLNAARAGGGRIVAVGTTSLRTLESAATATGLEPFAGESALYIRPGHVFRGADALMTNFHLPRSSLFVLVCALMGVDTMRRAYAHAVAAEYRFYSYGDACLLLPHG